MSALEELKLKSNCADTAVNPRSNVFNSVDELEEDLYDSYNSEDDDRPTPPAVKKHKRPAVKKHKRRTSLLVHQFVAALRDALMPDEEEEEPPQALCDYPEYAYVLQGNRQGEIADNILEFEKYPAVAWFYAFSNIIERDYNIDFVGSDINKRLIPPSKLNMEIDYEKFVPLVYKAFFEVRSKKTNNRLFISLDGTDSIIQVITEDKNKDDWHDFNNSIHEEIKNNNILKNKSLYLNRHLEPKFMKPITIQPENLVIESHIKEEIDMNAINLFLKADEYLAQNIPIKRGILLEGPAGTGKSMTIKLINHALVGHATIFYITDGVINDSQTISFIFDLARLYTPSVLIFEDIDTIGMSRNKGNSNFTSELLAQLDGLNELSNFLIIATTNHPELMDDALKNRPNRFDRRLRYGLPSAELRVRLFNTFLKEANLNSFIDNSEIINIITNDCEGFSGAMLREVLYTTKMRALHDKADIDIKHFNMAVDLMHHQYYDNKNIKSIK